MSPSLLTRTAQFILDCEARRDAKGRLVVYRLPAGDGGGDFEVAGINERWDHDVAYELRRLVREGKHKEAEERALAYYIEETNPVRSWSSVPSVEAYLRDTAFNRGVRGAARIVQRAVDVPDDGKVGPVTKAAIADLERTLAALLPRVRAATESYERSIAPPVGARAKFWKGLVNRWNKRVEFAASLL